MTLDDESVEERRRRRRAGDPRLTDEDRAILARLTSGDMADEFQAALDAVSEADPLLGGSSRDPDRHPVIGSAHLHGRIRPVTLADELLEERRRRRRAGDPRLSEEGRALLLRMVEGDLMDEFQDALDAASEADPLLGGSSRS